MTWGKNNLLLKKPVLIDGITRSGKSILSGIISSLKNAEQIKFFTYFEHIIPALSFKSINLEYAKTQIRLELNELAYNTFLGRNVNLRHEEQTSLSNQPHKKYYIKRFKRKEGEQIVNQLNKTENFFPFQTHELMPNIKYLNSLNINHKIIEIYRDPVDNIYSWIRLEWGKRFSEDQRSFTLNKFNKKNKKNYPWFCNSYASHWFRLNNYEKCAYSVCDLIERSVKAQKSNKYKSKVLTLSFENFYINPNQNLKRICTFLNTEKTSYTNKELVKANCPRKENLNDRKNKENFIRDRVSRKIFNKIMNIQYSYNKNLYGL